MTDAIEFVVRSSAVLVVGLIAAWWLRREPASLRHWILVAALALGATQPLITRVVPSLELPAIALSGDTIRSIEPGVTTTVSFLAPTSVNVQLATVDWRQWLLLVWIGGMLASLSVLGFGALWLRHLGKNAVEASEEWQVAADELRALLGIRRRVRILATQHPALLVTWGTIRPVILLPADAERWPADRVRLVLAHELAHLVRRDWLMQVLCETARAINWFNPLFWIVSAKVRRESEHACDDIVLELGIGGTSYASHLIDLARSFRLHGRTWLPAPSIARPSTLERRVRAMLNSQQNRRPVSILRRAALAVCLGVLAVPIAAMSLTSQATSTASGTVVDPMSRPLADAVVRLTPIANNQQPYETRTDGHGAFQLSPVPPGDYMLSLRSPGFSSSRQRLEFKAGEFTITVKAQVATLQETISVRGGDTGDSGSGRYAQTTAAPPPPSCSPSAAGQLTPPMKLRDVRPRYKDAWVAAGLQGTILMQARIGIDGRVGSVDALAPVNAELEDEAIAAVSQWLFSPTYLNCEPIEVQMYATVAFKLGQ